MTARRGFTLVEVCIVAVIFVVLTAGLLTTFLAGRTSYLSADAYIQVQQESRRAFDAMVRELRESGNVTVGAPGPLGGKQLNFQVALGYNVDDTQAPWFDAVRRCPANDICLGNDNDPFTGYVHYAVIQASGVWQLIRYLDTNPIGAPPNACAAPNCRVLANYYLDPVANVDPEKGNLFYYNNATQSVTVNLRIQYLNPIIPEGRMTSPQLTSRVTLRN